MSTISSTPAADGFYMPGEFAPHERCWMLWPERPDVWRNGAKQAQEAFADVVHAVAHFEPVTMGVSAVQYDRARQLLPDKVELVVMEYNDAWARDNGPTFVIDGRGKTRGIDWDFNAWGGLYRDWKADDALAQKILDYAGIGRYKAPLVMEGGAIDVDGEGTLIVTKQCLLNPNRNPHLSQAEIEAYLRAYLNVQKVIWLENGVFNDETDGHVDNLCCFVRPTVVALTWTDDENDPQYPISLAAYEQLCRETDARGRPLQIQRIHQPTPMFITPQEAAGIQPVPGSLERSSHKRLAGTYINYYVANGGVIVPQFDDPHDQAALDTIQQLFRDREVVGIYAREILLGGGNIHCITQQQPLSVSNEDWQDFAAFTERANEPTPTHEQFLEDLKANDKP
jgi:agmatine deiminase